MPDDHAWWRRTCRLAAAVLVIWVVVGVAIHVADLVPQGARVSQRSFGYLLAEIAAPLILAAVLVGFVAAQRRIDRSRGFGED